MDERDAKIRKQWLGIFILNVVQGILYSFLVMGLNPMLNGFDGSRYLGMGGALVGCVVLNYAIYRCIYKKPGTKLLTFVLAMTFCSLLMNLILVILGKTPSLDFLPYHEAIYVVSNALGICWLFACWRIRKVNQKLRALALAK